VRDVLGTVHEPRSASATGVAAEGQASLAVIKAAGKGGSPRSIEPPIATEVLSAHIEELAAWAVGEERVSTLVRCYIDGL